MREPQKFVKRKCEQCIYLEYKFITVLCLKSRMVPENFKPWYLYAVSSTVSAFNTESILTRGLSGLPSQVKQ